MKPRKSFFLYTEKYERITVKRKRERFEVDKLCLQCEREVNWLTTQEVAALSGKTYAQIAEMIPQQVIHVRLDADGRILICENSIREMG